MESILLKTLSESMGIYDWFEDDVSEREYKRTHSNCCDADILVGDVCGKCKEHCANQI